MPYYYGNGTLYFLFTIVAVVSIFAQINVKSTFQKYSGIRNARGYTGADVARMLLEQAGITDVMVEPIRGNLTDHYDPTKKVIRLSENVFSSQSVAALGVAAHETGHAIQHNIGYLPLSIRNSVFPAVNIGSKLAVPLIIIGVFMSCFTNSIFIAEVGIVMFSFVVFFQLVTLPVEFNASNRALNMLSDYGFLEKSEVGAARKVLSAAALTYVAAAATAILQLLRFISIVYGNNNRRRD